MAWNLQKLTIKKNSFINILKNKDKGTSLIDVPLLYKNWIKT